MAIASPFKKKGGSLQDRNGDSFPPQNKTKEGLFKIEIPIAPPFKNKKKKTKEGFINIEIAIASLFKTKKRVSSI